MHPSESLAVSARQPYGSTTHSADGVIVEQMVIPDAGTIVPQHAHTYDHLTFVAAGSLAVALDGEDLGTFGPGESVMIRAGGKHLLTSLQDQTIAYCIHNASRSGDIEVSEEHCLIGCHAAPRTVGSYTVALEPLAPALDEFLAIFKGHQPTEALQHASDPAVFAEMDALGLLVFVALRDAEGVLQGCTLSSLHDCQLSGGRVGTTDFLIAPGGEPDGEVVAALLEATDAALGCRDIVRWFIPERLKALCAASTVHHGFRPVGELLSQPGELNTAGRKGSAHE